MKKEYKAPVLTVYGDVIDLTQGQGFGSGADNYAGNPQVGAPSGPAGPGGPGTLSSYRASH